MSADERRAAIMAAAGPLFARDGYENTRLDEVAAAAGVTKPILYRHFDGKRALYLALLARHRDDLPSFFEQARQARAAGAPDQVPPSFVRTVLEIWFAYVHANRHAWLMLFRDSSGDEEVRAFRAAVSVRAREVMLAFVAARVGERAAPEQHEPLAELAISGLAGLALWWIDHPDVERATLVDAATLLYGPLLDDAPERGGGR